MPIFHKQTEVGDRLTAELSGQRTEGRPTLSLHASEIEDNDLRQYKGLSKVIIFQSFFNERPFKSVKCLFKIDEKEKSWNFFDVCIT